MHRHTLTCVARYPSSTLSSYSIPCGRRSVSSRPWSKPEVAATRPSQTSRPHETSQKRSSKRFQDAFKHHSKEADEDHTRGIPPSRMGRPESKRSTALSHPANDNFSGRAKHATTGRTAYSSPDQQNFDAAADRATNGEGEQPAELSYAKVAIGSFVELRTGSTARYAVLVETQADFDMKWRSITTSGEMFFHSPSDIQFVIPNFVSAQTVSQCGPGPVANDGNEMAARIQVLRTLREFMNPMEVEHVKISSKMVAAYEAFRAADPNEWSQTSTMEVARFLGGRAQSITPLTLLATHKHLMMRPDCFVVDSWNFLSTMRFHVRPQQHRNDLRVVETMISRNDVQLGQFAQKARRVIATNRKQASSSWSQMTSQCVNDRTTFTNSEIQIIRFLQAALRQVRVVQRDPFSIPVSYILKMVDPLSPEISTSSLASFLVDLGVLPPWEDLVTKDLAFALVPPSGSTEETLALATQSTSPILRGLGPQDYYPNDIVASQRHDFGDSPVYVIDDVGAQELDDGFSVEPASSLPGNHWMHMHIADPTSLIPPTHDVAKAAHRLTQSCYFSHKTIPMLPHSPEMGALSLGSKARDGHPEKVMTFSALVDNAGDIVEYKIRPGLIRNINILRYDDVDAALGLPRVANRYPFGGAPPEHPILPLTPEQISNIKQLRSVVERLLSRRLQQGALTPVSHDVEIDIQPKPLPASAVGISHPMTWSGFPQITYGVMDSLATESGSRLMVSECMKTASRIASRYLRDHGLPGVRRTLPPLQGLSDSALADLLSQRDATGAIPFHTLISAGALFMPGNFTTELGGHSLLGIPEGEGYVQVTSPLRRFADMVTHWQIKHFMASPGSPPVFGEEWMKAFAKEMVMKVQMMKRIESAHREHWALRFIQRWIDHPETHVHQDDPLRSLVAIPMSSSRHGLDGSKTNLCTIPLLGLRGTIATETGVLVERGVPLDVKVETIKLGFSPRLILSPK